MIKKTVIDLSPERRILTHMITSSEFLQQVKAIATPKLFQSSYSKTVATWLFEYFEHTNEAPGKMIEDIYIKKRAEINDENDQELIAEYLKKLSEDWEKNKLQNVSYAIKQAIDFFKIRSLDRLKESLSEAVNSGDASAGEKLITDYKRVDLPSSRGVDLLNDTQSIIKAFTYEDEKLFSFPGELGTLLGPFIRGDLVAFMGVAKKGKTHYMWYTAYRALMAGLRVVHISLEMTQEMMLRRQWQTMVGLPVKGSTVRMPYFELNNEGIYDIKHKDKACDGIDLTKIKEQQEFYKKQLRTGELKLLTFPSEGVTVKHIESELNNLEYYENFTPDVIVLDYADLLSPENSRIEYRHGLDSIWKSLRGIAQKRSILMVTGSQAGKSGFDRDITGGDVSEDYRKLAHVTKMISLNQNKAEYTDGVIRLATPVQREGKTFMGQIVVLQCYEIGRPYMDSQDKDRVNMKKYDEKENKKKKKEDLND